MKLFEIYDGGAYYWYAGDDLESVRELFLVDLIAMLGEKDAAETMSDVEIREIDEAHGRKIVLDDDGDKFPMWDALVAAKSPGQLACSEY